MGAPAGAATDLALALRTGEAAEEAKAGVWAAAAEAEVVAAEAAPARLPSPAPGVELEAGRGFACGVGVPRLTVDGGGV